MTARTWINDKLLDLAESLPATQWGPLSSLQSLRSEQRKSAADAPLAVAPPKGTRLSLAFIRLAEAYPIEHFDRVHATIQSFFPTTYGGFTASTLDRLDAELRSFTFASRWSIGILSRESRRHQRVISVMPKLPTSVDYIPVEMHNILPSVAVLTFDVHLTELASDELNAVQAAACLPEVKLRSLLAWQAGHSKVVGSSTRPCVRAWVDRFRARVETALNRHLGRGIFGSVATERPRLPIVEVYFINGDADLGFRTLPQTSLPPAGFPAILEA